MFPGDAILEVNSERVKYAPVEKVVEAIMRVPPGTSEMSLVLVSYIPQMIVVPATVCVTILCGIEPVVELNVKVVKGRAHICMELPPHVCI